MDISIHYRGRLDDPRLLPNLLAAARHFAFKRQWRYEDIDDRIIGVVERATKGTATAETESSEIDDRLLGILIHPHPDCGSLWLTFNQHGELCFYLPQLKTGHYREMQDLFTQTRFAPFDIHVSICELFHLIQDRYFPGLQVVDEGEYYATGNPARLAERLAQQDAAGEEASSKPEQLSASAPHEDEPEPNKRPSELAPRPTSALARPGWKHGHGISANRN